MIKHLAPFNSASLILGALALAFSLVGCLSPSQTLPPLQTGATRLEISARTGCVSPRPGSGEGCSTITDPGQIAAVEGLLNKYPKGWNTPFYGAPIHPVRLEFYRDSVLVEAVGLSSVSIERDMFLSRHIKKSDRDALLALIGLSPANLRFREEEPIPQ